MLLTSVPSRGPTRSKWLRIPLLYPYTPFTREERDKLAAFFEFKLDAQPHPHSPLQGGGCP